MSLKNMFRLLFRVGGCMVYGGWITTVVIIRPSQPSLAGVGAGAELGNIGYYLTIQQYLSTIDKTGQ